MLSIAKVGRGAGDYYVGAIAAGAEDHRRPGAEPDGVWAGRASEALGLRGPVSAAQLSSVLAGADPVTGEVLNPAQERVRVAGFDLVFAAPKSVSLCFALADPATSGQIRAAHEAAVAAALDYLEREAICARRGSGEERFNIPVEGLLGAAFLHRTSRAPDPHLHSHVLVANLVAGSDGRWSAFDARGLYAHARTAGFLYQSHLRHELSRRLGLEWGPIVNGMADIEGIDRSVIRAFSRRSQEIQAHMATEGRAGPKAARVAQLVTRQGKDLDTSFETLVGDWRARAAAAGLGQSQLAAATTGSWRQRSPGAGGRLVGPTSRDSPSEDWIRRIVGPEGLTATASTFSGRDVIRAICAAFEDGAAVTTVEAFTDAVLTSALVLPVEEAASRTQRRGGRQIDEHRWTTTEVVAAERALVGSALDRRGAGAGVDDPAAFEAAFGDRFLPSCQRESVEQVLASADGVVVATGARWAGCHDALDAARAAWEASGARVQAGASSVERAADFEALTGIETAPLAHIVAQLELVQHRRAPRAAFAADVLVVHDAGSLSLATTKALLDGAERASVKVVLVDEVRKLRAVDGGAFRRLGEGLGVVALDAPRSTVSAERIVAGGTTQAVERGVEGGAVVVGSSLAAVRRRLVDDWWAERQAGRSPAMVASSRRELDSLNAAARAELIASGQLGESMRVGRREMAVGDRVVIARGGRAAGLTTGTRATVRSVDAERQMLALLTEQGRSVSMSVKAAAAVEMRHAYAVTAREARKMRPDQALVLGEARAPIGAADNDRVYVVHGVGRSRRPAMAELVDERGSLRELGARLDSLDQRLARTIPRDPTVALAHLDQEEARAAERLVAARSVWSNSAARLEAVEARRTWTGRRAAREEAHDIRAEVAFRESEVERWERRQALLADRRRELEAAGASRAAELASRQRDRASRESLVEAVSRRQSVLARAAEVSPPAYLVAELGPRPAEHADRAAWREAALAVESHRERWGVSDQSHALGERAVSASLGLESLGQESLGLESLGQRQQLDSAKRRLEHAQSRLLPGLAAERAAERSTDRAAERAPERSADASRALEPASRGDVLLR